MDPSSIHLEVFFFPVTYIFNDILWVLSAFSNVVLIVRFLSLEQKSKCDRQSAEGVTSSSDGEREPLLQHDTHWQHWNSHTHIHTHICIHAHIHDNEDKRHTGAVQPKQSKVLEWRAVGRIDFECRFETFHVRLYCEVDETLSQWLFMGRNIHMYIYVCLLKRKQCLNCTNWNKCISWWELDAKGTVACCHDPTVSWATKRPTTFQCAPGSYNGTQVLFSC